MKLRGIAISPLTKMNKDGQDDRHVEGMEGMGVDIFTILRINRDTLERSRVV